MKRDQYRECIGTFSEPRNTEPRRLSVIQSARGAKPDARGRMMTPNSFRRSGDMRKLLENARNATAAFLRRVKAIDTPARGHPMRSAPIGCSVLNSFQLEVAIPIRFMRGSKQEADSPREAGGEGPQRHDCPRCGFPMRLPAMLPSSVRFPMQRFFQCRECKNVEMVAAR
jgi:hypothetical protein